MVLHTEARREKDLKTPSSPWQDAPSRSTQGGIREERPGTVPATNNCSVDQEGLHPSVPVRPASVPRREKTVQFNHPALCTRPEEHTAPWKLPRTQNSNCLQERPRGVAICTACVLRLPPSEVQTTTDGSCSPDSPPPPNRNSH